MARKKPKGTTGHVLFDVFYEDGSRNSNRKVPAAELEGPAGEDAARTYLEDQETKIGQMSGKPRARIKSIARSAKKKAKAN